MELNADGTLCTGYSNYKQTMQEGVWVVTDGALMLNIVIICSKIGEESYNMTTIRSSRFFCLFAAV